MIFLPSYLQDASFGSVADSGGNAADASLTLSCPATPPIRALCPSVYINHWEKWLKGRHCLTHVWPLLFTPCSTMTLATHRMQGPHHQFKPRPQSLPLWRQAPPAQPPPCLPRPHCAPQTPQPMQVYPSVSTSLRGCLSPLQVGCRVCCEGGVVKGVL